MYVLRVCVRSVLYMAGMCMCVCVCVCECECECVCCGRYCM